MRRTAIKSEPTVAEQNLDKALVDFKADWKRVKKQAEERRQAREGASHGEG